MHNMDQRALSCRLNFLDDSILQNLLLDESIGDLAGFGELGDWPLTNISVHQNGRA